MPTLRLSRPVPSCYCPPRLTRLDLGSRNQRATQPTSGDVPSRSCPVQFSSVTFAQISSPAGTLAPRCFHAAFLLFSSNVNLDLEPRGISLLCSLCSFLPVVTANGPLHLLVVSIVLSSSSFHRLFARAAFMPLSVCSLFRRSFLPATATIVPKLGPCVRAVCSACRQCHQ
jgi:hypothetical protein